ncbi:MAG: iron-sulfur cluster assembly protein, partial [Bacteroidota bacterium]
MKEIRTLLQEVSDPEIPVLSIMDMGVVREIEADQREV